MTLTCWYDYYYMDGHIKYFVSFIIILMIYVGSRYFILIFWKKTTCRAGIHCSVTSHKWWSLSFCYYLYLFNGPNCQIGWESERERERSLFFLCCSSGIVVEGSYISRIYENRPTVHVFCCCFVYKIS